MDETWQIVMYYDSLHSEEYITGMLMECLPLTNESRALNLYLIAATNNKCVIFTGMLEHAEHIFEKISEYPLQFMEDMIAPPVLIEVLNPNGKKVKL